MAKREEVWENVPSNTIQDIKLNCTVESLKAVADTVTRLQTRMDFLEQDMYMVLKEIYNLKEMVVNKKKEEDDNIPYQPKKKQRILVENEPPKKKNNDESSLLRE